MRPSSISRELSDVEQGLDERIKAVASVPPLSQGFGSTLGATYATMGRELDMRSEINKQLEQEQNLAFESSARQELARQAKETDAFTQEASDTMGRIGEKVRNKTDYSTALSDELAANPKLALNPAFMKNASDFGEAYKDPQRREYDKARLDFDRLDLGNKQFNAKALNDFYDENPKEAREAVDRLKRTAALNGADLANKEVASRIQQAELGLEEKEIQARLGYGGLAGQPLTPENRDMMQAVFDDFLPGIMDVQKAVSGMPSHLAEALANKSFIERSSVGSDGKPTQFAPDRLVAAVNAINDGVSDDSTKKAAETLLSSFAGKHLRERMEAKRDSEEGKLEMQKKRLEANKPIDDLKKGAANLVAEYGSVFPVKGEDEKAAGEKAALANQTKSGLISYMQQLAEQKGLKASEVMASDDPAVATIRDWVPGVATDAKDATKRQLYLSELVDSFNSFVDKKASGKGDDKGKGKEDKPESTAGKAPATNPSTKIPTTYEFVAKGKAKDQEKK